MAKLMSIREVATALGVSEQRVYQLDEELQPVTQQRGTKMKQRWYRPDVVERVRVARAAGTSPSGPHARRPRSRRAMRRATRAIAAAVVRGYAGAAPFFGGVAAHETELARAALREIADGLERGGRA